MKKKIKLLHIQLLPLLSGVQNMMLLLLDSLDQDKYEIYVISKPGGPLVDRVKESGWHYLPVKSLRRNLSPLDLAAFFHIFYLCVKYRFDIVHTHSSKTGFLGRLAASMACRPKIIHTVHGFSFHHYQPAIARYLYMFLESFAGHFCDRIVLVNHYEKMDAARKRIFPLKKMTTIHNGIDIDPQIQLKDYHPDRHHKAFEQYIKDKEDCFIIGSVLRFTRAKNIVNLTQTAIEVCKKDEKIVFILIGDGELWRQCKDLVDNAALSDRIIMPGWQNNIKEWLKLYDAFILYSYWEGLSISILEAMAAGLPIVASNIKGNNELVTDENGFLVDVDNETELVELLLTLPHRLPELRNMSQNSIQRIKDKFSVACFIESYTKLYEKKNTDKELCSCGSRKKK